MDALIFYNKLNFTDKSLLRYRFLDDKEESDLEPKDYDLMMHMANIVYPGIGCGHDLSVDEQEVYDLHHPNEYWD